MNGIVHRARVVLIETGKQLPFVLCLVVAISYAECVYALYFEQSNPSTYRCYHFGNTHLYMEQARHAISCGTTI